MNVLGRYRKSCEAAVLIPSGCRLSQHDVYQSLSTNPCMTFCHYELECSVLQQESEMNTAQGKITTARRNELDWLRVIAFGILIIYHIGMYYVSDWEWHIKSVHQSVWLQNIMLWSNQWRMLLLFLISGSAVAFIIRRMTLWQFYWSRHTRLFLPLMFGMAVVVVPQVFIEFRSNGFVVEGLGFFRFWLAYLDQSSTLFESYKTVGDFHITWNHLWFLMYIFCYSLIVWGLKLLTYLLMPSINTKKCWLLLERHIPNMLVAVVIPIGLFFLYSKLLYLKYPTTHAFVGDYFNHARSLTVFMFGYMVVRMPGVWLSIERGRWFTLIIALLSFTSILALHNGVNLGGGEYKGDIDTFLWSLNAWMWVLTVCGWGQHCLNRKNGVISYINKGVYCFYILHQTVIIIFAYHLREYELGPVIEPLVLIVLTSISCLLGYELLKRIPGLRLLFGIGSGSSCSNSTDEEKSCSKSIIVNRVKLV